MTIGEHAPSRICTTVKKEKEVDPRHIVKNA